VAEDLHPLFQQVIQLIPEMLAIEEPLKAYCQKYLGE